MNRLKKAVTGKSNKSSATDATAGNNHGSHGDGFADAPEVLRARSLPPPTSFSPDRSGSRLWVSFTASTVSQAGTLCSPRRLSLDSSSRWFKCQAQPALQAPWLTHNLRTAPCYGAQRQLDVHRSTAAFT